MAQSSPAGRAEVPLEFIAKVTGAMGLMMIAERHPAAILGAVLFLVCGGTRLAAQSLFTPTRAATTRATRPSLDDLGGAVERCEACLFPRVRSVLLLRKGRIEYERYWNGADAETLHDTQSAMKSITALEVGLAIEEGKIPSVSAPAFAFLSDLKPLGNDTAAKGAITIEDLLTMSSALDCNDDDIVSAGNEFKMYPKPIWARWAVDLPTKKDWARDASGRGPFAYCTAGSFLLGQIVQRATGVRIDRYVERKVLAPLAIQRMEWPRSPTGEVMTGGGLMLRTRDLGKLGQMILDGGRWEERTVVSSAWLDRALMPHRKPHAEADYGYQFWRRDWKTRCGESSGWYMAGNGGNVVVALKDLEAVIVVTTVNYDRPGMHEQTTRLVEDYVLPTVPCASAPAPHSSAPQSDALDESIRRCDDCVFPRVRSVLLLREGKTEYERYWNGAGPETLHDTRSAMKSVTALAVGVAIGEGRISAVSVPAFTLLSDLKPFANDGDAKQATTIEDLLTMSSALDCDDDDLESPGNEENMYPKPVWARWVVDLPTKGGWARDASGRGPFAHCTAGSFLLGQIVQRATGVPVDRYIQERILTPLGIERAEWPKSPAGEVMTGGGLRLRTRDLGKLGQMLLEGGLWEGRTIVPRGWIDRALTVRRAGVRRIRSEGQEEGREVRRDRSEGREYGYQFWRRDWRTPCGRSSGWYMAGNGGNVVVVVPDLQAVGVVTTVNYGQPDMYEQTIQLLEAHLFAGLPCVR